VTTVGEETRSFRVQIDLPAATRIVDHKAGDNGLSVGITKRYVVIVAPTRNRTPSDFSHTCNGLMMESNSIIFRVQNSAQVRKAADRHQEARDIAFDLD